MRVSYAGFDRPNLFFQVVEKAMDLSSTLHHVLRYIRTHHLTSTGIIYCMTKNDCEVAADFLRDQGVGDSLLIEVIHVTVLRHIIYTVYVYTVDTR